MPNSSANHALMGDSQLNLYDGDDIDEDFDDSALAAAGL